MTTCKNCGNELNAKYCAQCGQEAKAKRIDSHYISHEIQHLLHLEKGAFYTAKELMLKPGQTIRDYIAGSRSRHVKPIPFLIFTSLIYTLISHYFHIEEHYTSQEGPAAAAFAKSHIPLLFKWVRDHYGYANILMGGLIALWIKVFFRKYQYNIFEITVLLCFLMGQGMLFLALGAIISGLAKNLLAYTIVSLLAWVYTAWGIGQFFEQRKASSYIKAFLAYVIGNISFYLILFVIGIVCDMASH